MQDYITFHATEKVNKALESLIHTQEWRELEEYVFLHILAQENLSLTEGQLFQVTLTSSLFNSVAYPDLYSGSGSGSISQRYGSES